MMGNRKQPFGYKVAMGEIVHHPQEAKLVEYIFRQYLAGSTFNALVAELRNQPTPYDVGKVWNKNMVARILEDKRYTGDRGYPPIIEQEMLNKVLEKRSTKQVSVPKNEAQKLLEIHIRSLHCSSPVRIPADYENHAPGTGRDQRSPAEPGNYQ